MKKWGYSLGRVTVNRSALGAYYNLKYLDDNDMFFVVDQNVITYNRYGNAVIFDVRLGMNTQLPYKSRDS